MSTCTRHPLRKRPKVCATCAANAGTTVAQAINDDLPEGDYLRPVMWPEREAPKPRSPRLTADGATWLDPDGKPPVENSKGELVEPFVFQLANGARERWGVGLKLPDTPAKYRAWVAELRAARARIVKPKGD